MTLSKIDNIKADQSIIGITLLVKLLEQHGVHPTALLEKAGISEQLLNDPKAKITFLQEFNFTLLLVKQIKEDNLGFKAGQYYRLNAFGSIGLAA
ncbi:MAG: AraC family transcriptional regulator ligand-binding domain-containing protein, partial [Sinobacterium sp.]|nr:AraC family transcriptional regulator ligand-binding domain-containing protein [Sinobacterium sp.]